MNVSLSRNASRNRPNAENAGRHPVLAGADYAAAADALQIVGAELCETLNLYQDARVLDVTLGSPHAAVAAARRWCEVTSADSADDAGGRVQNRREAENLGVRFIARPR